jgi:hypothetical protein
MATQSSSLGHELVGQDGFIPVATNAKARSDFIEFGFKSSAA